MERGPRQCDAEQRDGDPEALSESGRDELARVRKQVIELETDNEFLRRAAACFARTPRAAQFRHRDRCQRNATH